MNAKKHRDRHVELHAALDELAADWIKNAGGTPSKGTVLDLMQWSAMQSTAPNHPPE